MGAPKAKVIKIAVDEGSKKIIESIADDLGLKQATLAGRVYRWFGAQDDTVQKAILGLLPKGHEVDVARLALERIIAGKPKAK